jgi:16S rRNA (guanine527-N7)-methyltransferase
VAISTHDSAQADARLPLHLPLPQPLPQRLREQICQPLGLNPSETQLAALLGYLELLARWNSTYNLTAVREREAMWSQHLADCLAVVPALHRHLDTINTGGQALRLLDVGSGGGLPGCLLAVIFPGLAVSCIDAVGKKTAFVRQVAGALALPNLQAVHARVEAWRSPAFDVIISRAFASLADFTQLTQHLLAPGGVWVAMKGKHPADEIAALPASVQVFHVEQLHVPGLNAERCLVWMRPKPESLPT